MISACSTKASDSNVDHRPHVTDPGKTGPANLRWLVRYARHCGFTSGDDPSLQQSLRSAFGSPAWRIVCKSQKSDFMPILSKRELSLDSLITYCQRLAERKFVQAPSPILLAYFTNQRRHFYDRACKVPVGEDYDVIRVANRHHQQGTKITLRELACVVNWAHQSGTSIQSAHRWTTLLARARKYFELERVKVLSQLHAPWHFFCSDTQWRRWQVSPLTDASSLWLQGQAHGNCLYNLRRECTRPKPSRFFAIRNAGDPPGKNIATLELVWKSPEDSFTGTDRLWGRWTVQDLRLSLNRLPDQALQDAMHAFAQMYNTWSQRPGRHPPGYADQLRKHISSLRTAAGLLHSSAFPTGMTGNLPRTRGSQYM